MRYGRMMERCNFMERVVDEGYESYRRARATDLDRDGDKDSLGIDWDDFHLRNVWRNNMWRNDAVISAAAIEVVGSDWGALE